MEYIHVLIHITAFGVLGCAASHLNTSSKSALKRPAWWVVMLCAVVIYVNTWMVAS